MASQAQHLDCGRSHKVTEWGGIFSTGLLASVVLVQFVAGREWHSGVRTIVAGIALGVVIADLSSGILHWAFDTWFDERQSTFQRAVLIAREHHTCPQVILQYPFRDYASFSAWPTLVVYGPTAIAGLALGHGPLRSFILTTTSIVLPAMFFGTHFHALGHHWSSVRPIRWLQGAGLVMSPKHHRRHHNAVHTDHYCTFIGVMNPICDRLGLWRGAEHFISLITGAEPRRDDRRRALRALQG